MPAKKKKNRALVGQQKIKEVNRLIRSARSQWKAHNNTSSRRERQKALNLYETFDSSEKEKIPQVLRVWLRYRSEKYFGKNRKGRGANSKG